MTNETIDKNETPETKGTPETDEIDTSPLEIPKMGYGKDFENKLVTFIKRGTFFSKPTEIENQNLNKDLLNEDGNLQRWYGVLDREYPRTMADGTKVQVNAVQLTKTQNDRLTALGNSEINVDKLFADGKKVKLVVCKVPKKNSTTRYWTLLTINQYKDRFDKEPLE